MKTDADTIGVATMLLIVAKKERRFLQQTAGKGSLKQPRYQPPFDQPYEEDEVANRQRTVKTCQRTAKPGETMQSTHTNPPRLRICCGHAPLRDLPYEESILDEKILWQTNGKKLRIEAIPSGRSCG